MDDSTLDPSDGEDDFEVISEEMTLTQNINNEQRSTVDSSQTNCKNQMTVEDAVRRQRQAGFDLNQANKASAAARQKEMDRLREERKKGEKEAGGGGILETEKPMVAEKQEAKKEKAVAAATAGKSHDEAEAESVEQPIVEVEEEEEEEPVIPEEVGEEEDEVPAEVEPTDEAVLVAEEVVVVCAREPEVEGEPGPAEVVTALVKTQVEANDEVDVDIPDDADVESVEAVVKEDIIVAAAIDVVEPGAPAVVCNEAAIVNAAVPPGEPVVAPPAVKMSVEEPNMAETGENGQGYSDSLEIVTFDANNEAGFTFHEDNLKSILLDERVKDKQVVVVSIAGAYRTGKSFLLNSLLQYFKSLPVNSIDDQADPRQPHTAVDPGADWLAGNETKGFEWRQDSEGVTRGINVYKNPIFITENIAVLLMDTQGLFDKETAKDSKLFSFSTLLSSYQIYNLVKVIDERDLQFLSVVVEYALACSKLESGKTSKESGNTSEESGSNASEESLKPFQNLLFLLRDWQSEKKHALGSVGGESYLKEKLEESSEHRDIETVRKHIEFCFNLSCFLLPHPGSSLTRKDDASNLDADFKDGIKEITKSIFESQDKSQLIKKLEGEPLTCEELFNHAKNLAEIFVLSPQSSVPEPLSIFEANSIIRLQKALDAADAKLEHQLDNLFKQDAPYLEEHELKKRYDDLEMKIISDFRESVTSSRPTRKIEEYVEKLKTKFGSWEKRKKDYYCKKHEFISKVAHDAKEKYQREMSFFADESIPMLDEAGINSNQSKARKVTIEQFDHQVMSNYQGKHSDQERKKILSDLDKDFDCRRNEYLEKWEERKNMAMGRALDLYQKKIFATLEDMKKSKLGYNKLNLKCNHNRVLEEAIDEFQKLTNNSSFAEEKESLQSEIDKLWIEAQRRYNEEWEETKNRAMDCARDLYQKKIFATLEEMKTSKPLEYNELNLTCHHNRILTDAKGEFQKLTNNSRFADEEKSLQDDIEKLWIDARRMFKDFWTSECESALSETLQKFSRELDETIGHSQTKYHMKTTRSKQFELSLGRAKADFRVRVKEGNDLSKAFEEQLTNKMKEKMKEIDDEHDSAWNSGIWKGGAATAVATGAVVLSPLEAPVAVGCLVVGAATTAATAYMTR